MFFGSQTVIPAVKAVFWLPQSGQHENQGGTGGSGYSRYKRITIVKISHFIGPLSKPGTVPKTGMTKER